MILVVWSELSGWMRRSGGRTFVTAVCCLALAGAIFSLRPQYCAEAVVLLAAWFGLRAGHQAWSEHEPWEWLENAHLSPGRYLLGKMLSVLLLNLIHLIIAAPLAVLMVRLWGVPWTTLAWAAGIALLTAIITSLFGSIGYQLDWGGGRFLSNILVLVWLLLTAVPAIRSANPLALTWYAVAAGKFPLAGVLSSLGVVILVLFSITVFILRREARDK